jgi:hypothetical protein
MISGTQTITLPADGMSLAAIAQASFDVDYAGEVTDDTAPNPPSVVAWGKEDDPTTVQAEWIANDPDSEISGYRYAIGSNTNMTDIVNWTETPNSTLNRSQLGLVDGDTYWVSVQARNIGGLWSTSGQSSFISGQPLQRVYLPLVIR